MAINKRKVLDSARRQAQKGAKQKALKEYSKLIAADPRDAKLMLEMGDVYRRWGKVEEAVGQYTKVASQYREEGFDARAVAVLKQILALDPKRYGARVELAELYQRMGLDSDALLAFQAAADGYYQEGRRREAVELLRRMVSLDPGNTTSRIKVAELLWQEGLVEDAATEFKGAAAELGRQGAREEVVSVRERVLEIAPDDVETLSALASDLMESGESGRAKPLAMRALKLAREAEQFELLCRIHTELGETEQVAELTRQLADYYRGRGEEAYAREAMQRLPAGSVLDGASLEPSSPAEPGADEFSGLGWPDGSGSIDDLGERAQAEVVGDSLHEEAVRRLADEDFILDVEAEEKVFAVESTTSEEDDQWVALEPETSALEQKLAEARVYMRYGKNQEAMDCLTELAERDPDQPTLWQEIARVHVAGGDKEEAREALQKALSLSVALALPDLMTEIESELVELSTAQPVSSSDSSIGSEILGSEEPSAESSDEPFEGADDDSESDVDVSEIEFEIELEQVTPEPQNPDFDVSFECAEEAQFDPSEEPVSTLDVDQAKASQLEPDEVPAQLVEESITSGWEASPVERASEEDTEMEGLDGVSQGLIQSPLADEAAAMLFDEAVEEREGAEAAEAAEEAEETEETEEAGSAEVVSDDLAAILAEVGSAKSELESAQAPTVDSEPTPEPIDIGGMDPGIEEASVPAPSAEPVQETFEEGDFDLAAELAGVFEEVEKGETVGGEAFGDSTLGEGMRSVFSHFKRGVSHTLAESDMETRFDLAIAYREMGLFEDAALEFQVCLSFPSRRLESLHMLGLCVLELGRPQDAAGHVEQALSTPDLSPQQEAALRFDLGRIRTALGDAPGAQECFESVARMDPDFPGLAAAVAETDGSQPDGASPDGYESFEDLFDAPEEDPPNLVDSGDSSRGAVAPDPSTLPLTQSEGTTSRLGRRKKISFV